MKKIRIEGFEFTILEEEEVTCDHLWDPYYEYVIVNPNQEFVVGYGSSPVSVPARVGRECAYCGLIVKERKPEMTALSDREARCTESIESDHGRMQTIFPI